MESAAGATPYFVGVILYAFVEAHSSRKTSTREDASVRDKDMLGM